MRFTIAAAVLAQTLPIVSSENPLVKKDIATKSDIQKKINYLVQQIAKPHNEQDQQEEEKETNERELLSSGEAAGRHLARRYNAQRNGDGFGISSNLTNSNNNNDSNRRDRHPNQKWTSTTPCDPDKFDADTGILSCGPNAFCEKSSVSPLGGVCAVRKNPKQDPKNHNSRHEMSKIMQKEFLQKKGNLVECDPKATKADVGILGCAGDSDYCALTDISSSGGICVPQTPLADDSASVRRLANETVAPAQNNTEMIPTMAPVVTTAPTSIPTEFFTPAPTESPTPAPVRPAPTVPIDITCSGAGCCDFGGLDSTTATGIVKCVYTDYYAGACTINGKFDKYYENGSMTGYLLDYDFSVPYFQSLYLKMNYGNVATGVSPTCKIAFNDIECNSCTASFQVEADGTSNPCYEFDCSNALEGHVGNSCNEPFAAVPIFDYCFYDEGCYICPNGGQLDISADDYFSLTDGSSMSCYEAFYDGIPLLANFSQECLASAPVGTSACCTYEPLEPCNICGDELDIVYPYLQVYNNYTCVDYFYAALYTNITGTYCSSLEADIGSQCCGVLPGGCNICGEGRTLENPDFQIATAYGSASCYDIYYGTLLTLSPGDECDVFSSSVGNACCDPIPPFYCSVCPNDFPVEFPDNVIVTPGQPPVLCSTLQALGLQGGIPEALCDDAQITVEAICGCVIPTGTPTSTPTKAPTKKPTESPTRAPTSSPTKRPTRLPTTAAPGVPPTDPPTRQPTKAPTKRPTESPTKTPTKRPTESPTKTATESPTKGPSTTASPTEEGFVPPCTLCEEGEESYLPNGFFPVPGGDVQSCQDAADFVASFIVDSNECSQLRAAASVPCGCSSEPLYICHICGEGNPVTNPNESIEIPEEGPRLCSQLEVSGRNGAVSESQCPTLQAAAEVCCTREDTEAPTVSPQFDQSNSSDAMTSMSTGSILSMVGMSIGMIGYFLA